MRTDRLQREFGVDFRWTVFPLHPDTPDEGVELSELFRGREMEIKAMQARLRQVASEEGLRLTERTRTYNSRRAQEIGKLAEALGKGDTYRRAVYEAYFVEGRNIADVDELVKIASPVGLAEDDIRTAIKEGRYAGEVDADWRRAHELGITAVPTHLFGKNKLVGFRPYDDFVRLIGK